MTTTKTMTATDTHRTGVIAGLRALADFLDHHPDLPTPTVRASVFPHGDTEAAERATVDQIAAVLGVTAAGPTHYSATRMFGGVEYRACAITRDAMARYHAATSYDGVVEPESEASR